jgi:iron transport multicopper oxidase
VTFKKPNIPVISPLLGRVLKEGDAIDPSYLRRHARDSVDFLAGLVAAQSDGIIDEKTLFLEVGPHPVCISMVKATLGATTISVPTLRRNEVAYKTVSASVSVLHTVGLDIDWNEYHRDFNESLTLLALPTYAFDEKNYWLQYSGDWCLTKNRVTKSAPVELLEDVKPKLATTTIHRVTEESVSGDVVTVSTESDLARPDLRAAVMGHLVNGAGLCPSVNILVLSLVTRILILYSLYMLIWQ